MRDPSGPGAPTGSWSRIRSISARGQGGRGIGRLLLARLVGEAAGLGFRQMAAVIGDGQRNQASVRLHAALGFRMVGTLQGSGYKHGRWLDTVFMQLSMNGGTAAPPDPDSLPERRFRAPA